MPLSGTITKAQIIDAVVERNGFTRKKSVETVEIRYFPQPRREWFDMSCSLQSKMMNPFSR
jgi:hypothetical protein